MSERESQPISLTDDRGRTVPVVFEGLTKAGAADKVIRARSALRMTSGYGLVRMLLTLGWLLGLMALWSFWYSPSSTQTMGRAIGFGILMVGGVVFWYLWYRRRRAVFVARLIERGRESRECAACGYGLSECAAADDGCTVCPECGGAWNLGTKDASAMG